jgi:chorismate mutase / prephenate dehydratase
MKSIKDDPLITPDTLPEGRGSDSLDLDELRRRIDSIDTTLLETLAARSRLSRAVVHAKERVGLPIRDEQREEDLLRKWIRIGRTLGLHAHVVTRIFHDVLEDSIHIQNSYLQHKINHVPEAASLIAFHGVSGSYCELAARRHFARVGPEMQFAGYPTFDQVLLAVERGEAHLGVLPLENTSCGTIDEVFDLLTDTSLSIVGEERFRVDHCLLGPHGTSLKTIRTVCCSSLSYGDCRTFLATLPNVHIEISPDSAMAARRVREKGDASMACIASGEAGDLYELEVVSRAVSTHADNYIRYLFLSRSPQVVDPRVPCKTSLVFKTSQRPGALVDALVLFRDHGINLMRLTSRASKETPDEECFYVDFEGNTDQDPVKRVIPELEKRVISLRILGSYPSQDLVRTKSLRDA